MEVLLARLRMLLGEERVGSVELKDDHRPDTFRMVPFAPPAPKRSEPPSLSVATGAALSHGRSAARFGVHIGVEVAVSDLGERLRPPKYVPHQYPAEPVRLTLLAESRIGYPSAMCTFLRRRAVVLHWVRTAI